MNMDPIDRDNAYRAQTGRQTARQRRRAAHKIRRAASRAGTLVIEREGRRLRSAGKILQSTFTPFDAP